MNHTQEDVLKLLFGDMAPYSHICSFEEAPESLNNSQRGYWSGGYAKDYPLRPGNQFICVSTFAPTEEGKSRRRKAQFSAQYFLMIDDIGEKTDPAKVALLPPATIELASSNHSNQWFYKFSVPCADQDVLDNLTEGMIEAGLTADNVDPGMRNTTRYGRLPGPGSVNSKAKRVVENNGVAPDVKVTAWRPDNTFTVEQLAALFDIDLYAPRKQSRVDGATEIPNHPILKMVEIKSMLSPGRYDIVCPKWEEHTGGDKTGTAVFTNDDGTIGMKCMHGSHQDATAKDLIDWIDEDNKGFKEQFGVWRKLNQSNSLVDFATNSVTPTVTALPALNFMGETAAPIQSGDLPKEVEPLALVDYQALINQLRQFHPGTLEQRNNCEVVLHAIDGMKYADKLHWSEEIRSIMGWSKTDLDKALKDYRAAWYEKELADDKYLDNCVFVSSLNQFYDRGKRIFMTPDALQNTYCHEDDEVRKTALMGRVTKVDMLDYYPGKDAIFIENGRKFANTWSPLKDVGTAGDVSIWLNHFEVMGWGEHKDLIIWWQAITVKEPWRKVNFAMGFCSREGVGKDFVLYPLIRAMREHSKTIHGEALFSSFNEYLLNIKHLHINEVEMGEHSENRRISNKLKPMITAPPETLDINVKGVRGFDVQNMLNLSFSSNSPHPIYIDKNSRRYYMMWSDLNIRNDAGQVTPEWRAYWKDAWAWMKEGDGWLHCLHYLLNNVDLGLYDPGSSPTVTDFAKEIQQMSASPIVDALGEIIEGRISLMSSDIVTIRDVSAVLQTYFNGQFNRISNVVLGRALREMGIKSSRSVRINGVKTRLCVIRDDSKYEKMDSGTFKAAYLTMSKAAKTNASLQLVTDEFDGVDKFQSFL